MKKTILASFLLAFAVVGHAGDNTNIHHNNINSNNSYTDNSVANNSNSASTSHAGGGEALASSAGQSNNMSVTTNHVRNVASAHSAQLITSNDTCMGSSSVGGQGAAFGFSVGSTWTDEHCKMLKSATILYNMGLPNAAVARLCMDKYTRFALESTGVSCPTVKAAVYSRPTFTSAD